MPNERCVAPVFAVSRLGDVPRAAVEDFDATFAMKIVGHLIGLVIKCVRESLSENLAGECKRRMIKIIATAGAAGVTRGELTHKDLFIRNMREGYLTDLIDGGEIIVKAYPKGRSHGGKQILSDYA